jgi:predicted amidohydrolase
MKVGYLQFNPVFGKKEQNLQKISGMLSRSKKADLLVLPELCTSGYLFKTKKELIHASEFIPDGETTSMLIEIAKEKNMHLVAGMAERDGSFHYNSAVLVGPKGYIGKYRKIHLFNEEKGLFKPGDSEFPVFEFKRAKVGLMICFDWIFPESARVLALKGAEIICHPGNFVLPYAFEVLRARAIENRIFIITSSRTGRERGLVFQGKSQVVAPDMRLLVRSGKEKEEIKIVDIDLAQARNKKVTPKNDVISDRRTKFYRKILEV